MEEELREVKREGGENGRRAEGGKEGERREKGRVRREEKLMDRWESNWGNMTENSRTHADRDRNVRKILLKEQSVEKVRKKLNKNGKNKLFINYTVHIILK
jgi:hypothetical protein